MADSNIKILKTLFEKFFSNMTKPNEKKIKNAYRFSSNAREASEYSKVLQEWEEYKKKSKAFILSYAATVSSLSGVIGQPGVDAFNKWLGTYAVGDGGLTEEAIKALKAWYDQYLKPLS